MVNFDNISTPDLHDLVLAFDCEPVPGTEPDVPCGRVTYSWGEACWSAHEQAREELSRRAQSSSLPYRVAIGALRPAHIEVNTFPLSAVEIPFVVLRVEDVTPEEAESLITPETIRFVDSFFVRLDPEGHLSLVTEEGVTNMGYEIRILVCSNHNGPHKLVSIKR